MVFIHSIQDAGFHDHYYNYLYEWALQSFLWLDNGMITTAIGPCLTSDQHRVKRSLPVYTFTADAEIPLNADVKALI